MFCILAAFLVAGGLIMQFLGISIPGLRVAGGLVIAAVGLRMLFLPQPSTAYAESGPKHDISFTPLAIPSLAGPGSIAVVIGMSTVAQADRYVILRHVMIVVGGIIPSDDHAALRRAGVTAIFPPGTPIADAASALLDRLNERLGYAQSAAE